MTGRVTEKTAPPEPDPILEAARETREIDLDAARAARAEKRGPAPVVKIGGKSYTLPDELPAEVVTAFGMTLRGDVAALDDALAVLFDDQLDEIKANGLSWDDQAILLEGVLAAYDFELPESSASGGSSSSTSNGSRPTSKRSTGSTSRKRSGASGRSQRGASAR